MRKKIVPIVSEGGYSNQEVLGKLRGETEKLVQTALVDLWEIDFRKLSGEVYRFCNFPNERGTNVVWKGYEYQTYPVMADGSEYTSQGASNRPPLTLANLMGFVTAAAESYNQMVGVPVKRIQTYERFLDAVNFVGGNPDADPMQEVVSLYIVERLVALNADQAVLELAYPAETDNALFPSRMMLANTCPWQYRGGVDGVESGCPYRGRAVADKFDMPTNDLSKDECSRTLLGCKARFGETAVLPYGGFISTDKVG